MFCLYVCIYITGIQCLWRLEKNVGSSENGIRDDCKAPCRLWEKNPGTLQEQQALLTTDPSLQTLFWYLYFPSVINTLCGVLLNNMTNQASPTVLTDCWKGVSFSNFSHMLAIAIICMCGFLFLCYLHCEKGWARSVLQADPFTTYPWKVKEDKCGKWCYTKIWPRKMRNFFTRNFYCLWSKLVKLPQTAASAMTKEWCSQEPVGLWTLGPLYAFENCIYVHREAEPSTALSLTMRKSIHHSLTPHIELGLPNLPLDLHERREVLCLYMIFLLLFLYSGYYWELIPGKAQFVKDRYKGRGRGVFPCRGKAFE